MKTYCHWVGTDSLTLISSPPGRWIWHLKLKLYRLKWKVLYRFFDQHWAVSERVREELLDFGIPPERVRVRARIDLPQYIRIERRPHEGFNIMYYKPPPYKWSGKKYRDWVYGIDIIEWLKGYFRHWESINWIEVDGTRDLREIYPITDLLLRPTRHDGAPRMVMECEANGIPVYYRPDFTHERYYDIVHFIINRLHESVNVGL